MRIANNQYEGGMEKEEHLEKNKNVKKRNNEIIR